MKKKQFQQSAVKVFFINIRYKRGDLSLLTFASRISDFATAFHLTKCIVLFRKEKQKKTQIKIIAKVKEQN